MLQTEAYLMMVIYDCKTFLLQATGASTGYIKNLKLRSKVSCPANWATTPCSWRHLIRAIDVLNVTFYGSTISYTVICAEL
jgi:hypothetical protein